jgi:hypothetical protein
MRALDILLLIVAIAAGFWPIVVLPRTDIRVRRWTSVLATVGFAQSLSLFLIPYDRHSARRDVWHIAVGVVIVGALVVLRGPKHDKRHCTPTELG